MLSKEEIEFNLKALSGVMLNFEDRLCDEMQERVKEVKEYIEQLEHDKDIMQRALNIQTVGWNEGAKLFAVKQKLIEKLEERIKAVDKCYNELLTDVAGIKIINVTGLTKKEKGEIINKRNCLLVQKHCYEEILEILKN